MILIDEEALREYAIECNRESPKWTGSRVLTMIAHAPTIDADLREKNDKLKRELQNCRNQLCAACGAHRLAFPGTCDGCILNKDGDE